jgi:hypothetical protein
MSLNSLNPQGLFELQKVSSASENPSNQLPEKLTSKLRDTGFTPDAPPEQMNLATKSIKSEFVQTHENKGKFFGIFNNFFWSERCIESR